MFTEEAIQKIIDMGEHEVTDYNDVLFHVNHRGATHLEFPITETIKLFSLNQLVNLMRSDDFATDKEVHIISPSRVNIIGKNYTPDNKLVHYGRADASEIFEAYSSGNKLQQEDFIISLMSKFQATPARDELIKLVSVIKDETSSTQNDDGFSQNVTVKAGVTLVKEVTLKNLWQLQPFYTFPEIEQPKIPFIFRVHKGSTPLFSLHQCDGGAWKVETTGKIREFLVNALPDSTKFIIL